MTHIPTEDILMLYQLYNHLNSGLSKYLKSHILKLVKIHILKFNNMQY